MQWDSNWVGSTRYRESERVHVKKIEETHVSREANTKKRKREEPEFRRELSPTWGSNPQP
jgi:hypothetical protein